MFIKICASGVTRRVETLSGISGTKLLPSPIEGVWIHVEPTSELNENISAWTGISVYGHALLVDESREAISESLIKKAGLSIVHSTLGLVGTRNAA
jgi:hypothetical protein